MAPNGQKEPIVAMASILIRMASNPQAMTSTDWRPNQETSTACLVGRSVGRQGHDDVEADKPTSSKVEQFGTLVGS